MLPALAIRMITTASLVTVTAAGVFFGYRFVRADLASDVYRERLTELSGAYQDLAQEYNRAVSRTAVAELVVEDGALSVRIRTDAGVIEEIPTSFDPAGEIYVDYAVVDGRLWIRRVFDELTAPRDGLVLDPVMGDVDWEGEGAAYGKAVYRSLSEGRWVVSVTGSGALGLVRAGTGTPGLLARAPAIEDFETIADDADARVTEIGAGEVLGRLLGGGE